MPLDAESKRYAEALYDPVARFRMYWIVDKAGQARRFELNDTQRQLLSDLHGRDIILKARQLGVTTLMCLVALDECLTRPNWRAAIIAHRLEDAKSIFDSKVKFAYDRLPDGIRASLPTVKDSADTLHLANGSSISVTTSARSGTLQRLHISEFGKICATNPSKAREIISGSLPAAERGAITIESTAEGQEGKFYEMVRDAREVQASGRELGPKDYRFHFFPWWIEDSYRYPADEVRVTPEDERYFSKLADENGIHLDAEQKAWWIKTEREQGGDMGREYPATPDEAFEQAIEGAYFEAQLLHAMKRGHIGEFSFDPKYPVNTFWDLGRNDNNAIWLHQRIKGRNRFVGYYENSGEYIAHYIRWLREWGKERDAEWGEHYWPHDGRREDLFLEHGRTKVVEDLGFKPRIVERVRDKAQAIEAARAVFAECDFDETACALGLRRLRHYRKEWDEQRGVWKDRPRHDDNAHGADAFMTFATGYKPRPKAEPLNYRRLPNVA